MKVIPTEQIEWETVVTNARAGHVQRKYVRKGEILPGVGYASEVKDVTPSKEVALDSHAT
jgi:hypothetical protein